MEFPIKFDIPKSGWSIVYIMVIISKNIIFLFLKIGFVFVNNPDPDAFYISYGSSLFVKVPLSKFLVFKGLSNFK